MSKFKYWEAFLDVDTEAPYASVHEAIRLQKESIAMMENLLPKNVLSLEEAIDNEVGKALQSHLDDAVLTTTRTVGRVALLLPEFRREFDLLEIAEEISGLSDRTIRADGEVRAIKEKWAAKFEELAALIRAGKAQP